jgi:hypothetical protein
VGLSCSLLRDRTPFIIVALAAAANAVHLALNRLVFVRGTNRIDDG